MAEATADVDTQRRVGAKSGLNVAASTIIYAGILLCISTADGYLTNPGDGSSVANLRFAGIGAEYVDNSSGSDGDEVADVWVDDVFLLGGVFNGDEDIGSEVYLVDNQLVGLADDANANLGIPVGIIVEVVSSSKAWVRINARPAKAADESEVYQVTVPGVNATAFDLSGEAGDYGGSDFFVEEVVSVFSLVTATGAFAATPFPVATTDWTLAGGDLSTVGDETANTWVVTFRGYVKA